MLVLGSSFNYFFLIMLFYIDAKYLTLHAEIHLMSHRPSVIAAAASLVVINNSLTRTTLETQMNSVAYPGFLNIVSN